MNTVKQQFELTEELTKEYNLSPSDLFLADVNVWVTKQGDVFSMRNGKLRKLKQAKRHGYNSVTTAKNYAVHRLMDKAGLIDTSIVFMRYNDDQMNIHHIEKVTNEICDNNVENLMKVPAMYHSLYNKVRDVIVIEGNRGEHMDVIGALIDMRMSVKTFKSIIKNCKPYAEYNSYKFYSVTSDVRTLHFAVKFH